MSSSGSAARSRACRTEIGRNYLIRSAYFWGLMETGQRRKALELWKKSEKQVMSVLESPKSYPRYVLSSRRRRGRSVRRSHGAPSISPRLRLVWYPEDRRQGVELAKKLARYYAESLQEDIDSFRYPISSPRHNLSRLAPNESLLAYCLVRSGLWKNSAANPYLKDQPKRRSASSCETPVSKIALYGRKPTAILAWRSAITTQSMGYADCRCFGSRTMEKSRSTGGFKRVDQELGLDVKGIVAAFADVDNDGLADVIVAGQDKFGVSMQTKERMFRPVLSPAGGVQVNASAIGLFDGDGDGLIDVYLGKNENGANGRTTVLQNKGSGKFEEVTEPWGFKGRRDPIARPRDQLWGLRRRRADRPLCLQLSIQAQCLVAQRDRKRQAVLRPMRRRTLVRNGQTAGGHGGAGPRRRRMANRLERKLVLGPYVRRRLGRSEWRRDSRPRLRQPLSSELSPDEPSVDDGPLPRVLEYRA